MSIIGDILLFLTTSLVLSITALCTLTFFRAKDSYSQEFLSILVPLAFQMVLTQFVSYFHVINPQMMANDTNYQLFAWWVSTASIICTTILLYTVSRYLVLLLPIPKKKTTIALIIIKIVVALFAIGSVVTILLVSDVQPIIVMNITFSYHFFAASSLMVILGIAAFHYKKFAKGWEQESLLEGITATFLPLLFTFPIDLIFFREQTFKIAYLSYSIFVVYLYFFISRQYFQQYEHPIEQGVIDDKFLKQKGISIREKEVLLLLIRGKTSFEIGTELFISHNTVKTHIKHIYEKLQVSTRVQLYALIAQHTSQ